MGKNSPSKLRWEAKQLEKEAKMCLDNYARSILNAAKFQSVFQYNPFSSAKPNRYACILKHNGYLKLDRKIKPGWWNLKITEKGLQLLASPNTPKNERMRDE